MCNVHAIGTGVTAMFGTINTSPGSIDTVPVVQLDTEPGGSGGIRRKPCRERVRMWFKTTDLHENRTECLWNGPNITKHHLQNPLPNTSAPLPQGDALIAQPEGLRKHVKKWKVNRR